MITIEDTLAPDRIALGLTAADSHDALAQVAALFENTPQVLDAKALAVGLTKGSTCLDDREGDFAICLPHTRTDAVTTMVMAVGRFDEPMAFPDCGKPIRYIFCIGVPKAMNQDYLRILGLLARIMKDPAAESQLRAAKTGEDFIECLGQLEAKL